MTDPWIITEEKQLSSSLLIVRNILAAACSSGSSNGQAGPLTRAYARSRILFYTLLYFTVNFKRSFEKSFYFISRK